MKIGLFGGSFNPIHMGHLIVANAAATQMDLDKVLFIPAPLNPFKQEENIIGWDHRCEMIRLSIEDNDNLKLSLVQSALPKPSYTIDMLDYLKEHDKENKFVLIIGSDLIPTLPQWKNFERIKENYEIYYYRRTDYDYNELKYKFINSPAIDISSSIIRKMIQEEKDFRYLVPEKVYKYIKKKGLYK